MAIVATIAVVISVVTDTRARARVSGALPRWVAGSGYIVAGLLVLAGWTWFPLPLTVLWALVAGVRLLLPARDAAAPSRVAVAGADRVEAMAR